MGRARDESRAGPVSAVVALVWAQVSVALSLVLGPVLVLVPVEDKAGRAGTGRDYVVAGMVVVLE